MKTSDTLLNTKSRVHQAQVCYLHTTHLSARKRGGGGVAIHLPGKGGEREGVGGEMRQRKEEGRENLKQLQIETPCFNFVSFCVRMSHFFPIWSSFRGSVEIRCFWVQIGCFSIENGMLLLTGWV